MKVLAEELYAEATLIAGLGLVLPDGKPDTRLPRQPWQSLQLTLLGWQVSSRNPDPKRLDQSLEFLRANAETLKPVLADDAATFALIGHLMESDVAIGQVSPRSVMLGAQLAPVMQAAYDRERSLLASGGDSPARSAASQFVTGAGVVAARMLLNEQGALDLNVVRDLKQALETNPLPRELAAAPVPWYSRVLGNLAADAELVKTLEAIQAPKDQTSPAASIIRTTLGLRDGETVSALHARQAVLSAVFTPLRQGAVGSCFATSVAIRLQQLQPSQMVQDMAQLISSGELVFTRPDGSIKRLLLSETASTAALSEPIALPASDQARAALAADPGLRAALLAVGIDGKDIANLIGKAIDTIAAKPRAAGADLSTSASEIVDEVLLARHGIPRPDLDEHKKVPQLIQDVLRCQLELESLRAAPSRPNATMRINAKEAEIDALMDRRQAIADLASASLMPQFLHERDLAVSAWQGTEDNRILRAWEYTLSARAESNVSDRFMKPLSGSISALAANELRLGKLVVDGTLIRQVETELERLIKERFDYAYDASMRSTLAADGSSTEGGFVLVDNGRPGSGNQPTRIDDAETFQMMMAALSAQALQNVAAQLPQSAARGTLQAAGQQLIRAWFASKPAAAGAKTLVDNVTTGVNLLRRQRNENIDAALPWALPDGYDSIPVLRLRAGAASNVVSTRMPKRAKGATHSPEDVASFLIDAYVSGLNACHYCYGVHSQTAQAFGVPEGLLDQLLVDIDSAPIDEALKPLLRYARKLTQEPTQLTQADAQAVFQAGWSEIALHEAVLTICLFNFMNRLLEGHGITGNPTLHELRGKALKEAGYDPLLKLLQPK